MLIQAYCNIESLWFARTEKIFEITGTYSMQMVHPAQQVPEMSETNMWQLLPSSFSNIPITTSQMGNWMLRRLWPSSFGNTLIITSQMGNWMLAASALLCSLLPMMSSTIFLQIFAFLPISFNNLSDSCI